MASRGGAFRGVVAGAGQGVLDGMPRPLYAASPTRLLTFLECPRRYRFHYLDSPRPLPRPQRAHTSIGIATHNALRSWWDLPAERRTPAGGADLLRRAWIETGFRDGGQSRRWQERVAEEVRRYLVGLDPGRQPPGIERTVALRTRVLAISGRVDRLDERAGELVVVDYKTSRTASTRDEARTSLALGVYAAAASRMFRKRCVRVELHHVPTGSVAAHTHTPESLERKLQEADSIGLEARAADESLARGNSPPTAFRPVPSALCTWCDYRAACPEGQLMGPEKSSWAALEPDAGTTAGAGRYERVRESTHGGASLEAAEQLGGRDREPEGRRREDDIGGEPGRGLRGTG